MWSAKTRAVPTLSWPSDGEPVESASTFVDKIEDHQPGEQMVLTILRQGQQIEVPMTLGSS